MSEKQGTTSVSVEPQRRLSLPLTTWEELNEPGAYVEVGSGDLYRFPTEALIAGASPIMLVQVSANPFCTTLHARMVAAEHNIEPNF